MSADWPPNLLQKRKELYVSPRRIHYPEKSGYFKDARKEVDGQEEKRNTHAAGKLTLSQLVSTEFCQNLAECNLNQNACDDNSDFRQEKIEDITNNQRISNLEEANIESLQRIESSEPKTYKRASTDLIDLVSNADYNYEEWKLERTPIKLRSPFVKREEKLDKILYESIEKDSDESDYEDSQGAEKYNEMNPLGAGWKYAIYIASREDPMSPGTIIIELFTREYGRFEKSITKKQVERLGDTVFVRYRMKNNRYEIFPSCHGHCHIGALKIRPGKSVEMKPIAVVAYSKDTNVPVPVWSDIIGWRTIDHRHRHVFRKGLVDKTSAEVFKPLRLIEFLVKIRLDVPWNSFQIASTEYMNISDVSPFYINNPDKEDLPDYCYPKCPRRIDDLKYIRTDEVEYCFHFESPSQSHLKFWASIEQCWLTEKDREGLISGVFAPLSNDEYRGLVVAPIQRLHRITKGHFLNYRRFPPRREETKDKRHIERIKSAYNRIEKKRRWEV